MTGYGDIPMSVRAMKAGVAVYIEAEHFCTQARGVRELSSRTGTLVMRGAYNDNPLLSQEFRLMIDRRAGSSAVGS
jgi:GTP cyclohydrolase I